MEKPALETTDINKNANAPQQINTQVEKSKQEQADRRRNSLSTTHIHKHLHYILLFKYLNESRPQTVIHIKSVIQICT